MGAIVLSEHEQLCRTAHQQVAMLRHLYQDLLVDEGEGPEIPGFSVRDRMNELAHTGDLLSAKLKALGLLPASPDPEWEGVLEAVTKLKRAFSAEGDTVFAERLAEEEDELLGLLQSLAHHDPDPALDDSAERAREALKRLGSAG